MYIITCKLYKLYDSLELLSKLMDWHVVNYEMTLEPSHLWHICHFNHPHAVLNANFEYFLMFCLPQIPFVINKMAYVTTKKNTQ